MGEWKYSSPIKVYKGKERNEILLNLVLGYDNRETLVYLKGIAHNFTF